MPRPSLLRSNRGASLVEVMVAFVAVAIAVPTIMGWVTLSNWNDAESRALLHAYTIGQAEVEWLQANCANQINVLIDDVTYDPQLDKACDNYPKNIAVSIPDKGTPGLQSTVDVDFLTGEEGNYEMAMVTVKVEWERAYLMRKNGKRTFVGYLFGSGNAAYWEFYDDWTAR